MTTPPDGIPPRMQMYLFHEPGTAFPDEDPFLAGNSGDEADIVYHEYTHGLSNRLVVDANGVSTLGNVQAGSMGEAWSDWYAMDFLVNEGLFNGHQRGRRPARRRVRRLGQRPHPHPAARLPGRLHLGRLPGYARRRPRWLHLRRLRPDHRCARGARRR